MNLTFLDFETTGLNPKENQVIQIGAVKIDENFKIISQYTSKVALNEGQTITEFIQELTGIKEKDLKNAVEEADALEMLIKFIGDDPVVAQFASFDLSYLNRAEDVGNHNFYCTKSIFNLLHPDEKAGLKNIVKYYGIPYNNHHNAMADVKMTIRAYKKMLEEIEEKDESIEDYMNIMTTPEDRPLNYVPDNATVKQFKM